jgi:phage-related protein
MRYEITEIPGKGTFTDELGFSAYLKEMKIGIYNNLNNFNNSNNLSNSNFNNSNNLDNLNNSNSNNLSNSNNSFNSFNSNNFDINKIADYFSGSGEIIFSNEPDKYYLVNFLEQIDFERLVRFRIASVKMLAQPYKYLSGEPIFDIAIDTQTEIQVENQGLAKSKPIITIYGSGQNQFYVNGIHIFDLNFLLENDYLTVDSAIEECYKDTTSNLKNNQMNGNFPVLNPGENTISWEGEGSLTRIIVKVNSRWI